jgi:hypothetical protein
MQRTVTLEHVIYEWNTVVTIILSWINIKALQNEKACEDI